MEHKKDALPSWKVILLLQLLWLIPCIYAYKRDYVEQEQAEEMAFEVSVEPLWEK